MIETKHEVKTGGAKTCECCEEAKYSTEFADSGLFMDGKSPICATCARGRKYSERVAAIMAGYEATAVCKKCGNEQGLGQFFTRQADWYKVGNVCLDCRSARFETSED
jgi:hypothetical protein